MLTLPGLLVPMMVLWLLAHWSVPPAKARVRRFLAILFSAVAIFLISPWACLITIACSVVAAWWSQFLPGRGGYWLAAAVGSILTICYGGKVLLTESLAEGFGLAFVALRTVAVACDANRMGMRRGTADVLAYNLFLPAYGSGPIEEPRFGDPVTFGNQYDWRDTAAGFRRIGLGLIKAVFVSDALLLPFLATRFPDLADSPGSYGQGEALAFVLCRFLAVFLSFSGHIDLMIGIARLLGIRLSENFANPLAATNVQDFWQRWHMTLGRWNLRYLLPPAYRCTRSMFASLCLVFLVIAMWHRVTWQYALWGLLQACGVYVAAKATFIAGRSEKYRSVRAHLAFRFGSQAMTIVYVATLSALASAPSLAAGLSLIMRLAGA